MRATALALLCVLALAACGCGGGKPAPVTGTVTFDGKPLPDGDIMFIDEGGGAPDAGKIKDGAYSVPVKPGKKKVQIRATKLMPLPAGKKGAMGETEMPTDYIPAKYNDKTELTADVSPTSTTFDFKLTP